MVFVNNVDGEAVDVNIITGGSGDVPFNLQVNQGKYPTYSAVDKFGENPQIDKVTVPEDVWEYGGLYTYDTNGTAPIISLVSTSTSDTMDVEVTGLDIDGYEVKQTITLTGTTRVALTTALWRVYRVANVGTADTVGTVYCYTLTGNTPSAASIRAMIDNGNNQTLMALYTVPRGKVGFLYRGEMGGSRKRNAGAAQCSYYSRRFGKVFRVKKRISVVNSGSSTYQDSRSFPDIIPALTDIKLTVEDVSDDDTGVFGTFDILLIDESDFSTAYLQAIGQPYV